MQMDPELEALGADLTRQGNTVVPHGDHLCLRLPFFTSVRIRKAGDALQLDPRFGLGRREPMILGTTGALGVASAISFVAVGMEPLPFVLGLAGLMSAAMDAWRLVLTESAITRIQFLRAVRTRAAAADAAPHLSPLPHPTERALVEPPPAVAVAEPRAPTSARR